AGRWGWVLGRAGGGGVLLPLWVVVGGLRPHAAAPHHPARTLIVALGYPSGFLLVMLGHMQLFTENTITTVLPVLERKSASCLRRSALLWGVVLGANVLGAGAAAAALVFGMMPAEVVPAMVDVAREATSGSFGGVFAAAIPAGFVIAVLVWVTRLQRQRVLLIALFTWVIAAAHFKHVIVGSVEMFVLLFTDGLSALSLVLTFFLPALAGNVVGGTLMFALMAWAQVSEESKDADDGQKRGSTGTEPASAQG
ncbi:MAG: formate/nitrite transporter family protein, partial [Myxococcota bacterium]